MCRGGATLPLGGAVAPAKKKKKKKGPPTYRQILIGPPTVEHPAPSHISIRYFISFPNSSFKCRPFYSLIKQNMAYSPLIFKYPKHYPTKQHFITHSPTQNQKIQNPLFCFFFTLFLFTVYMPPPTPLVPAAPKQNKTLSLAQLSHPLKLSPHDPKKKKKN